MNARQKKKQFKKKYGKWSSNPYGKNFIILESKFEKIGERLAKGLTGTVVN